MEQKRTSRNFRGGAYTTLLSLVVIVILIVVNLLASALSVKVDLTDTDTYSLSTETKNFLKDFDTKVTLYYVTENDKKSVIFSNLAEAFASENACISIEYKDPVQYPAFVYQYNNMETINNNSIILVNEDDTDRYCYIDYEDMCIYNLVQDDTQNVSKVLYGYDTELELVKGLVEVTEASASKITFTKGHGEDQTVLTKDGAVSDTLRDLLSLNRYDVAYLDTIKLSEIPEDAGILCLAGLSKDLTVEETEMIKEYMNKGGNVLVFLWHSSEGKPLENLTSLLDYYGMTLLEGLLYEGDDEFTMNQQPAYVLAQYGEGNCSYALGCGVLVKTDLRQTLRVESLSSTTKEAYLKMDTSVETKEESDLGGEFSLFTKATEEYQGVTSNLYVFNTAMFLSDKCIEASASFTNKEQLLSVLSEITGENSEISIPIKKDGEAGLVMTDKQQKRLAILSLGVLPGICLLAGAVMLIRRAK